MLKTTFTLLLFLLLNTYTINEKTLEGKVINVADGDTITILDKKNNKIKIRFHGIDCPEKGQDFFNVAKDYTKSNTYGKTVKIKVKNIDRYQRTVGEVIVNNNINLNIKLLEKGLAWHYTTYDKSFKYAKAELTARNKKLNIWSLSNAIAPWDFRKAKRKKN